MEGTVARPDLFVNGHGAFLPQCGGNTGRFVHVVEQRIHFNVIFSTVSNCYYHIQSLPCGLVHVYVLQRPRSRLFPSCVTLSIPAPLSRPGPNLVQSPRDSQQQQRDETERAGGPCYSEAAVHFVELAFGLQRARTRARRRSCLQGTWKGLTRRSVQWACSSKYISQQLSSSQSPGCSIGTLFWHSRHWQPWPTLQLLRRMCR